MKHKPTATRRAGMAIIAALVVMATLTILLTVVAMQIVAQRQTLRQRQRQLQAEWLARAGVEIAVTRLLENPAGFSEEKNDLLPDAKVRIVVEKSAPDVYSITADAAVGQKDELPVLRSANARFRRTDSGGAIRLQAVALDKN
jgi:type II secretory pathway pseudopilin PulG